MRSTTCMLAVAASLLACAAPAAAQTGGAAPPDATATTTTGPPAKAKLTKKGMAIPPANAPSYVVNAINAANSIRKLPYRYGGGHASFSDSAYDCSGAVSFALYGAGLLSSPMPSGSFVNWGEAGKGQWITVYANGGHMYAVIAGLRWDTSSAGDRRSQGKGPRWRFSKRKPTGYAVRHLPGY